MIPGLDDVISIAVCVNTVCLLLCLCYSGTSDRRSLDIARIEMLS